MGRRLAVANRAVDLRGDVVLFDQLKTFGLRVLALWPGPVELSDKFLRPDVLCRVAMALQTPSHRQLLVLMDDLHLVDTPMARNATDPRVQVGRMVEVDEFREVVNSHPADAASGLPAFMNRCQFRAGLVNGCQSGHPLIICRGMAIDAGGGRRDRRMGRFEDGVVAIPTVHLQLAGMNRVAERDRLFRLITDVQRFGVSQQSAHRTGINYAAYSGRTDQHERRVDPTREEKSVHNYQ